HDGGTNAIVIGVRAAGKVRVLENCLQARSMQGGFAVGIMTWRTLLPIDGVAAQLGGSQLAQGFRRSEVMASSQQHRSCGTCDRKHSNCLLQRPPPSRELAAFRGFRSSRQAAIKRGNCLRANFGWLAR